MVNLKQYALYKGDEFLCLGTIAEIAKHQGVTKGTVKGYGNNAYKKNRKGTNARILIRLDDKEDD